MTPLKLLLIDDDRSLVSMLSEYLVGHGLTVRSARMVKPGSRFSAGRTSTSSCST